MEQKINHITIKLIQGDITELAVDGIVNAANNRLRMGGGVAGAIKRKGGKEIEDEAVSKGPIPIGEAVITGAGKLKAQFIIRAAVMGMDFKTNEEFIRKATANSLKCAAELGIKSIAFPALGTGVGGFPLNKAAEIMFEEVKKFASQPTNLKTVIFALFNAPAYQAFEKALPKIL